MVHGQSLCHHLGSGRRRRAVRVGALSAVRKPLGVERAAHATIRQLATLDHDFGSLPEVWLQSRERARWSGSCAYESSLRLLPQEQKPLCEGGGPQLIDMELGAIAVTARTMARNSTGGGAPPIGSRGVDAVTSARIAPYEQMFANTDRERVTKLVGRLSLTFSVGNVVMGFRRSVSDGFYASADWVIGSGLALVPVAGVPLSLLYSAHGGTKAIANDIKYISGQCRKQ